MERKCLREVLAPHRRRRAGAPPPPPTVMSTASTENPSGASPGLLELNTKRDCVLRVAIQDWIGVGGKTVRMRTQKAETWGGGARLEYWGSRHEMLGRDDDKF
jgi:hypothetical protein